MSAPAKSSAPAAKKAKLVEAPLPTKTDEPATKAPVPGASPETFERLRKQRTRLLALRLGLFVVLPTLLATIYYAFVCTNQYESYAQFTVHSVESQGAGIDGLLGGLIGSASRDTLIVRDYIHSRDMLAKLDEKDGFIAHWKSADIDPIARMDDEASFEEAFEQYIDHVGAQYDTNSGVLTLEVRATDAASAKQFAQTILEYSEERVNELTQREREDRTRYAEEQVEKQEARLTEARRALLQQQSEHAELSPMQEAGASMTIRTQLESDLAHARAQLMQLKSYMTPEAPKVKAAQERVKALSAQIGAEKKRLVDPKGEGGIAKSMAKFDATMLEKEFAETAYRSAMASLEVARADAARQHRYLAVIAPPSVPDEATHPERALGVLTVFIMSFLLMGIGSLLVASVREHARV